VSSDDVTRASIIGRPQTTAKTNEWRTLRLSLEKHSFWDDVTF